MPSSHKHHRRSHSPELDSRHHKHRHKDRSRSRDGDEGRHRRKIEDNSGDRRENDSDYRRHHRDHDHRDRKRREHRDHDTMHRIKQEPLDTGYDRAHEQSDRAHNDQRRENRRRREAGNPFTSGNNQQTQQYGEAAQSNSSEAPAQPKEEPNFEVSGKLTEDTNTYRGVVIKYNEPPEARKPKKKWRLYPFKGDEALPLLHLHRASAFLMGRDRKVVDIPVDHPSCSKQHAVLQFRLVPFRREDGSKGQRVRPYIIDLGSSNGTYLNSQRIDPQKYVELMEKDVLKFGYSSREYVLLHDKTDTSELHEDDAGESD